MTNHLPPEPEAFAAAAQQKMVGRKWSWLSGETGINAGPLKRQLVTHPESLKLRTAARVARALELSIWGEAA
jgi:hypothetical protein